MCLNISSLRREEFLGEMLNEKALVASSCMGDMFLSELQVNGLKHLVFTRLAPQKRMVAQVQVTSHGVEGVAIELQHVDISERKCHWFCTS
jgi:hypothetical protein